MFNQAQFYTYVYIIYIYIYIYIIHIIYRSKPSNKPTKSNIK